MSAGVVLGASGSLSMPAAAAAASSYTVHACSAGNPGGFTNPPPTNGNIHTAVNCDGGDGSGEGLQAWSTGTVQGGQAGGWWFSAPPGTSITALLYGGVFSAWDGWVAHWATSYNGSGDPIPFGNTHDCQVSSCNLNTSDLVSVPSAQMIGVGLWCDRSSCPAYSSSSTFGPAGSINIATAWVGITDPDTSPALTVDGQLWRAANGQWISGLNNGASLPLYFGATDPGSVCGLEAAITDGNGNIIWTDTDSVSPAYQGGYFTEPLPCGRASANTSWQPDLAALPTGLYHLNVGASNPAGWQAGTLGYAAGSSFGTGEPLLIDNSLPSVSVAATQRPDTAGWYDSAPQDVSVTGNPAPGASPISSITCAGPGATGTPQGGTQLTVPVGQPGGTVSCTSTSAAGNASPPVSITLHVDAQAPTVSFAGPSGWVTGPQTVTATGAEPQQLSGIASVSCQVNDGAWSTSQGSQAKVSVSAQGTNTISCYSTTVAGMQGPTATRTVQVDSTPPAVSFTNGPDQSAWHTTTQSIDVTATKPADRSAIKAITCTIEGRSTTYPAQTGTDSETVHITVQPPGGQLSCTAADSAGNVSGPQTWGFLIDDAPPTGTFQPTDPRNPQQVTVLLADSGSGVAGARIEIQTVSGWRVLPTAWNPTSGVASATVPDDGSLPDGTYDLEALVWDAAGNQTTITQAAGGGPQTITLPVRIATSLHVADAIAARRQCTTQRIVVPHRHRHGHGHGPGQPSRLQKVCTAVPLPHGGITAHVDYGQQQVVHGRLTTLDGSPIPNAPVNVVAKLPGWPARTLQTVTTDANGNFTYTLSGASETVTFTYAGTSTLRYSAGKTMLLVIGKARINVGRGAQAGRSLKITGHVFGGYVPRGGVLVQLQYRIRGVPVGWAPFHALIHTNRRGLFATRFPVSRGARGYTYLLRATIDQQSGWPFETTTSNVVARRVR